MALEQKQSARTNAASYSEANFDLELLFPAAKFPALPYCPIQEKVLEILVALLTASYSQNAIHIQQHADEVIIPKTVFWTLTTF